MADLIARLQALSGTSQAVLALCAASALYVAAAAALGALALVARLLRTVAAAVTPRRPRKTSEEAVTSPPRRQPPPPPGVSLKSLIKSSKRGGGGGGGATGPDRHASSELFINGLRGHGDAVTGLAFSADGRALATACEDRVLRVFDVSGDVTSQKIPYREFEMLRTGVRDVAFGSSSTQVVALTRGEAGAGGLSFVDLSGREGAVVKEVEYVFAGKTAQGLCLRGSGGSGAAGNVPVLAAVATTTEIKVHLATPSLPDLAKIDTGGFNNYWAAVSNDGRFLAAATFASDVKIYEAEFDRAGSCTGVKKVMDLKGHKKKVTAVEFSPDGRQAVTASEDGTLRIWNINVRYKQQEDPKATATEGLPAGKAVVSRLAWGRGGHIAAACGADVYILAGGSGKVVEVVEGAHAGAVADMAWCPVKVEGPQGAMTLLATAGADARVRLWRGPWALF